MAVANVYSSVIPLASGAVAAGPLGGAGPTVVAGPSGTVTSSGVAAGRLGLGLGWGGLGGWGGWGGAVVAPAVSRTVIAGPAVWGGGLGAHGWW